MNVKDHEPFVEGLGKVRRYRSGRIVAGLAAAVVLAGALSVGSGGEAGSDVSTGPPPTTVSPSAAPSVAPSAPEEPQATPPPAAKPVPTTAAPTSPPPAPERLTSASRLRLDGIGPIQVGMTLAEASVAAGVPVRIDPRTDLGGGCAHAIADGGPQGVRFMVVEGQIVRVEVAKGSIRTLSGIGTGSTVDEVLATYPNRIRIQPNPYTGHLGGRDLLYVTDEGSRHLGLMFQADGQSVRTFRSGFIAAVMAPEGCA